MMSSHARIRVASGLFLIAAVFVVSRLYGLQVVSAETYRDRAERQYLIGGQSLFDRGFIFFQKKDGVLVGAATLDKGFYLYLNPSEIKSPEETFAALEPFLNGIAREEFINKAARRGDIYEELLHRLPEKTVHAIESLKLAGVHFEKERWRIYPAGTLGAAILGFLGLTSSDNVLQGRYGLERYYNDVLFRNGGSLYQNFFASLVDGASALRRRGIREGDLVTTIEPMVQTVSERELSGVMETYKPEEAGILVMDPFTGAIVAMAVLPSFDPNNIREIKNPATFSNPFVERVYEMGSIIKPLTMAAGLDSGAIKPDSTYYDAGTLTLNGSTISNFDGKGRGRVSMQEVLNQSLNTGAAYVAKAMGKEKFSAYFKSFGFGEETGIDLPAEVHGLVQNLDSPRELEHATAAFGQGIALTPIETARALSSLGNGGFLPSPHVVKEVRYASGGSKIYSGDKGQQVLKPETSEEITRMLVAVVDKALLDGKAKLPHHSVAAKTGTAQIAKKSFSGYEEGKYLHSFFGYFPAYKPQFLIFLYAVEPKGVTYASQTLTTPFLNMTKFLLNYYEIPPDR